VYLPEGAVWDMNEIMTDDLRIPVVFACASVHGNGAEIQNLRFTYQYGEMLQFNSANVDNIKFTNFVTSIAPVSVSSSSQGTITRCVFSGLLASGVQYFSSYGSFTRCAFNIEFQTTNYVRFTSNYGTQNSCRIRITAPNAPQVDAHTHMQSCELQIFAPNATTVNINGAFENSTLRGNLQGCTNFSSGSVYSHAGSIYNSDSFPAGTTSATLTAVTDAQMQDADYLRSIGFMIGVS
jgi:hypothetical protein